MSRTLHVSVPACHTFPVLECSRDAREVSMKPYKNPIPIWSLVMSFLLYIHVSGSGGKRPG